MRAKFWFAFAAIACCFCTALHADVIEGFESGNTADYSIVAGSDDNLSVVPGAAHDRSFGAHFGVGSFVDPDWYLRSDLLTGPDASYTAFVRLASIGALSDRVYVGIGATPTGTWSMVAAGNTGQLLLDNNDGYGYVDASSSSFTWVQGVWYQMALDWYADGDMQVKLFDETGTTLLASSALVSTGDTTPGGLAIRGFYDADLDTISNSPLNVPETSSFEFVVAALVGLAILRYRRNSRSLEARF